MWWSAEARASKVSNPGKTYFLSLCSCASVLFSQCHAHHNTYTYSRLQTVRQWLCNELHCIAHTLKTGGQVSVVKWSSFTKLFSPLTSSATFWFVTAWPKKDFLEKHQSISLLCAYTSGRVFIQSLLNEPKIVWGWWKWCKLSTRLLSWWCRGVHIFCSLVPSLSLSLSLALYINIYTYIYMYVYIYTVIYIYICICIHINMNTRKWVYIYGNNPLFL